MVGIVVGLGVGGAFGRTARARTPLTSGRSGALRGVTPTSLKIVLYQPPEDDTVSKIVAQFVAPADNNAKDDATVRGFIKALFGKDPVVNGRRIDLVVFTGSDNLLDSVAARADAVRIAEDIRPFAVLNGPLLGTAFADELASRGVMCLMCVNAGTDAFFAAHAPYVWSLETTPEQVGTHAAEYVRKRLAGHPAAFAGSADLRRSVRRFGLLSVNGPFGGEGLGPSIESQLHARGVALADNMSYGDANSVNQVQATMIGRLKAHHVTTVIYAGDPIAMGSFMAEATSQRWYPEWVMTGGFSSERSSWGRRDDPAQMAHAFGVTPLPPPVDPRIDTVVGLYRKANGVDPPASQSVQQLFAPIFVLYSGLTAAGRDLTPQRFQQGLFHAPPLGGSAATPYIPLITYGEKGLWPYPDYAGVDDFSEIWWDPTATGADEFGNRGHGMWRFADGGRRYVAGKWPTAPPHAFIRRGSVTRIGS